MASGKTHATVTLFMVTPLSTSCALILSLGDFQLASVVGLGSLTGLIVHPDLDLPTLDFSENKILKWTFGLGAIWVGIWYPYAKFFPHRHFLTHFPFISTFIRLYYLLFWLTLFYLGLEYLGLSLPKPNFTLEFLGLLAAYCGGLCLSDIGHWILDGCPTRWKGKKWYRKNDTKNR